MSIIQLLNFDTKGDQRGQLVALESMSNIPFEIKRVYYMTNLDPEYSRGFHAHKMLKQVAICLKGSCRFEMYNGNIKEEIILNSPAKGLMIPEMIWHEMHDFTEDCILMVLANAHYCEDDYIRDMQQFIKELIND